MMNEDSMCGKGCGMEPMGCASCREMDLSYESGDEPDDDPNSCDSDPDEPTDMSDVEADGDALASAGWGTDEDYGYYGGGDE